jgi:hypothetical protein
LKLADCALGQLHCTYLGLSVGENVERKCPMMASVLRGETGHVNI